MRLGEIEGNAGSARLERDRVEHTRNSVAAAEGDEDLPRCRAPRLRKREARWTTWLPAAGGQAVPGRQIAVRPHAEGDVADWKVRRP